MAGGTSPERGKKKEKKKKKKRKTASNRCKTKTADPVLGSVFAIPQSVTLEKRNQRGKGEREVAEEGEAVFVEFRSLGFRVFV